MGMTLPNKKAPPSDGTGFIEIDFSSSEQGSINFTNSYSPRLRHAYIQYKNITFGQNWTTLINTHTFAETVNLGGPLVGQAMIRQSLLRYHWQSPNWGDWRIALENIDSVTANQVFLRLVKVGNHDFRSPVQIASGDGFV